MGGEQPPPQKTEPPSQPQPPPSEPQPPLSEPPPKPQSPPPPVPISEPPTNLPTTPSNPTKIPIRPQKIRKLSSTPSPTAAAVTNLTIIEADSTKILTSTDATTAATVTKTRRRNPSVLAKETPKIIKPLSTNGEVAAALRHLRSVDPLLANIIDLHPSPTFDSHQSPFLALTKSILYQQLAYKAGTSIFTRFVSLCGGDNAVLPDTVLGLTAQQLKQIGVSGRKASYLYDLANKYKSGILSDETVVKMDDRSLFTMLSMVKGIGAWSVHMFMIFSLHRPDVLPVSDLGVRKGVQLLYGLEELPRPSQMEQMCEKWKPYRTVGAWYMWRFVEAKGPTVGAQPCGVDGGFPSQQQIEESAQSQQHHQLQLLEPLNTVGNYGASMWGQ